MSAASGNPGVSNPSLRRVDVGKGTVAVIGGGLAGLAAGCALADAGYLVELFERRPFLGGRASSYELPGTGEVVDNCQHVLLGCCTNLVDFYCRLGVEQQIRWYHEITFVLPGGKSSVLKASNWPAPFHAAKSFLKSSVLSFRDKLAIARAMLALIPRLPQDNGESFQTWLERHGQTQQAIDRFWAPVLVSALNEDLDRIGVRYAAFVFRESFLKSPEAGWMGVPAVPLSDLYGTAAGYIEERGGRVHLRGAVDSLHAEGDSVRLCVGGEELRADYAVLATPFNAVEKILPQTAEMEMLRGDAARFTSSPITGVHLWFDREITPLEHAVLLERTIQWMFHKSKILRPDQAAPASFREGKTPDGREPGFPSARKSSAQRGSYLELVVSSSKALLDKPRQEIIDLAVRELAEFFPTAHEAKLIKATVVKEVHATFSPAPGSDAFRPSHQSPWPRLFLAGDWTATGWPATMEGAVRSGYGAAQALSGTKLLVPDLPAKGLMRLFAKKNSI
jgi:squalene-associated FAD-dependent desaturase